MDASPPLLSSAPLDVSPPREGTAISGLPHPASPLPTSPRLLLPAFLFSIFQLSAILSSPLLSSLSNLGAIELFQSPSVRDKWKILGSTITSSIFLGTGDFLTFGEFQLPEHFAQLVKVHWNKDPVPPVFSFPQLGAVEEIVGEDDPAHPARLGEGDVQLVGGVAVLQTDLGNKGRYQYNCPFPRPSFMLNYQESYKL